MAKRLIPIAMLLLILSTSYVLITRHQVESGNRTISLLMDGPELLEHSEQWGIEPLEYLIALRNAGLFGVIVPYEQLDLRSLVADSGLAVVPIFDKTPLRDFAEVYDLQGVAGVAFADSHTTGRFLEHLDLKGELLFLIQRNDTFRGYLPSEVHQELITQRYPAVRTYRISRWETDSAHVTPDSMAERWLMNIREYNTRALYARPFLELSPDANANYVRHVVQTLRDNGYDLGLAEPYASFYPGKLLTMMLLAAVLGLALLLCGFLKFPEPLLLLGAVGALCLILLSIIGPLSIYIRLATALAGAVAASCLGLVWAQGKQARRLSWWLAFLLINITTLSAALITASVLSDTDFLMEYNFFRGVKVQYLLPLLVVGLYLAIRVIGKRGFQEVIAWPFAVKLIFAGVGGVAVAVYLWRSGDVEQISSLEQFLRQTLDRLLVVRPRFKELMAHPVLLLTLYWRRKLPRAIYAAGIMAAAVGQVSMVNTFMHLRTPLALSLLRTVHGLWMGAFLGVLMVLLSTQIVHRIQDGGRE